MGKPAALFWVGYLGLPESQLSEGAVQDSTCSVHSAMLVRTGDQEQEGLPGTLSILGAEGQEGCESLLIAHSFQ